MDPNTQTPDLQSATGQTPLITLSGPSMMSALQGMQGPSPGLAAGSGVLNTLGGGRPGANPYLAQQNVAEQQMVQQVIQVQEMQRRQEDLAMRATELRQRREERKQESLRTMLKGMIDSDDPKAKAFGWTQMGELSKQQGVHIPPDVIQGLARGKLTKGDLEALVLDVHAKVDPNALKEVYPWLTPSHMSLATSLAGNPDYMRRLGIDPEELARKKEDHQLKIRKYDLDVIKEKRQSEEFIKKLESDKALAGDRNALDRAKLAEQTRHNKEMEKLGHERNETRALTKEEKKEKTLAVMEHALEEIISTAKKLHTKGYFHDSTGGVIGGLLQKDLGPAKAAANWVLFPNDPDLKAWKGTLRSSMVGMDRQILDEIGARGAMVWGKQLEQFDSATSLEGAIAPALMMQKFLKTAREGRRPEREHIVVQMPDGSIVQERNFRRGMELPPGGKIIKVID